MECEPDKRIHHPWREVYYRYYIEAMSSAGLVNGISDAGICYLFIFLLLYFVCYLYFLNVLFV